jgi:hypothetical protein
MPFPCQRVSAVAKTADGDLLATPLRCKQWQCPTCAPINRRLLLKRLEPFKATTFLTLTCNPTLHTSSHAAFRTMSVSLNYLIKRLRRAFPAQPITYFLIWERTKAGWPHAHMLLNAPYIPQAMLSRMWTQLTGAPIVDIRAVRSQKDAQSYLTKYLTKSLSVPPHQKRYRSSRALLLPPAPSPLFLQFGRLSWTLTPQAGDPLAGYLQSLGWHVFTGPYGLLIGMLDPQHPPPLSFTPEPHPQEAAPWPA